MPDSQISRRKEERRRDPGEDFQTHRRAERGEAELKPGRVLTLVEIGTTFMVRLAVEQMVDQVRGERNQVCEEEARREPSGDEPIQASHRVPIIHEPAEPQCHPGDTTRAWRTKTA